MLRGFNLSAINKGLTLIELLSTLAIIAIISMTSKGLYTVIIEKNQQTLALQSVEAAFKRIKAFSTIHQKTVVLCGTSDKQHCSKDWSDGFMSFVDDNRNHERDPSETLVEYHTPLLTHSGSQLFACYRRYFKTRTFGPLASLPDSIVYLPQDSYSFLARKVVISRLGRTRIASTSQQTPCTSS